MGTYVQISRDELENWLDSIRLHSKWYLQEGRAGIYLLPLSEVVGVKLSSTIGTKDDAMGRGQASMQLSLISLVTKQILNKKAQGQSHFNRTLNWRNTWDQGIDRMRDAYMKSQGFYDAIAVIQDREEYKNDLLQKIQSYSGWESNEVLADFHKKVLTGGVLTAKQIGLLESIVAKETKALSHIDEDLLNKLRLLYSKARQDQNTWLTDFVESVGKQVKSGRPLSIKQQDIVDKGFMRYKLGAIKDMMKRNLVV
jgi:hypothetical protein